MESDTNISSLGTVGKVAIVVAVIVAVVVLRGAVSTVLLFTARTVNEATPEPNIERIEEPYMEMAPEVQMSF